MAQAPNIPLPPPPGAPNNAPTARMELNTYKAGMAQVDKSKIDKIIYEMSKDSPFYQNEQKKDQRTQEKIKEMKEKMDTLAHTSQEHVLREVDRHLAKLEAERDLTRSIVHLDMDMFYAAVAIRDNPALKGKPIAVGGMAMISTSSYEARAFGVRAAMPGYIGKALCPELIFVDSDWDAYKDAASKVRVILAEYDPEFEPMGMDENYMDLTDHLKKTDQTVDEVVHEIRRRITEATQLTASAGIAPNKMLAKICSDQNKPNGQFRIQPTREAVMGFIDNLPVRKIPGIGKVAGQLLASIGVLKCAEIRGNMRAFVKLLFSEISANFFFRSSLGLGSTTRFEEAHRKSLSADRTFQKTGDPTELLAKLRHIAEALASRMEEEGLEAKNITLKCKTDKFELSTKSFTSKAYVRDVDTIYEIGSKMLMEQFPVTLRLIGMRVSQFKGEELDQLDDNQRQLDFFFKRPAVPSDATGDEPKETNRTITAREGDAQMEEDGEDEDLEADNRRPAKRRRLAGDDRLVGRPQGFMGFVASAGSEARVSDTAISAPTVVEGSPAFLTVPRLAGLQCPVCSEVLHVGIVEFNLHLDRCAGGPSAMDVQPAIQHPETVDARKPMPFLGGPYVESSTNTKRPAATSTLAQTAAPGRHRNREKPAATAAAITQLSVKSAARVLALAPQICPVCGKQLRLDNRAFNAHVDSCLLTNSS